MTIGIGLRAPHYRDLHQRRPALDLLEIHAENYMGAGGPPLNWLEAIRADYPISVHGVGLSLGSAGRLDAAHLERLASLAARIEPVLVSEHLAWCGIDGIFLNDLLPLPLTEEALAVMAEHVAELQDRLRRPVLIENPSTYLEFAHTTMEEPSFLAELARRTGCGLLLDVNNCFVSAANHGGDAAAYLDAVPVAAVGEIHLAGHAVNRVDGRAIRIDDHGSAVCDEVWSLYRRALGRGIRAPTVVEWDSNIPPLDVLLAEADRARTAAA
jgi:uncharacterized protein (UPF0276 family)